jgi:APA family basic amino acid/polyamine antiporter
MTPSPVRVGQAQLWMRSWRGHTGPARPVPFQPVILTRIPVIAALIPLSELAELVDIGTLFAFILVAVAVIILRRTRPDLHRAFRCPGVPTLPLLSVLASLYLMLNLPALTWVRFFIWMAAGLVVCVSYGRSHSRLGLSVQGDRAAPAGSGQKAARIVRGTGRGPGHPRN